MVGTPQYNLGKYLHTVINPVIPSNFMLSSSKEFIDNLKNSNIPSNNMFVSFDVVSLFTNVPLDLVIDLCCSYVYNSNSVLSQAILLNISKNCYDLLHLENSCIKMNCLDR